jgi:hypothetical protein
VSSNVQLARQHWEQGRRRFDELAREPRRRATLHAELELLVDELRRRVGSTFTLAELATAYDESERWAYDALAERFEDPSWTTSLTAALDAAFHVYARGARDYAP